MKIIRRDRLAAVWREWVRPIVVILVICGSFRSAVADWNDVPTGSMKPTIVEGDRIFVNKTAYGLRVPFTSWWMVDFEGPRRGDIIVFFSPVDGTRMVKRVVGLPGDRIETRRNRLFVNGEPASYEPLDPEVVEVLAPKERSDHRFVRERITGGSHPIMAKIRRPKAPDFGPMEVPSGEYFVMGDNRDHSHDSRVFGCVQRGLIVGRASTVILSVDRDNYYLPRCDRFFHSLP
jgi:signal peptidase I